MGQGESPPTSRLPQRRKTLHPCRDDGDGDLEVRPRGSSKTAFFTLRHHATERHHAAPSSESRWTTAKRTMTPAEASLKGVDRPPAIKERRRPKPPPLIFSSSPDRPRSGRSPWVSVRSTQVNYMVSVNAKYGVGAHNLDHSVGCRYAGGYAVRVVKDEGIGAGGEI